MANNGCLKPKPVNVLMAMLGMDSFVTEPTTVLLEEFGTVPSSNVFALKNKYGMEDNAQLFPNAVGTESTTSKSWIVSVELDSSGTQPNVCSALTERFGINLP